MDEWRRIAFTASVYVGGVCRKASVVNGRRAGAHQDEDAARKLFISRRASLPNSPAEDEGLPAGRRRHRLLAKHGTGRAGRAAHDELLRRGARSIVKRASWRSDFTDQAPQRRHAR